MRRRMRGTRQRRVLLSRAFNFMPCVSLNDRISACSMVHGVSRWSALGNAIMNSTISRPVLALAASLIGVGWAAPAQADSFKFPLTGEQCVPPVATGGTGEVELTYDPATRVVTWNIPYSGLSSAVTLAHFHGPAIPGKSAPVVVWLAERGSAPGNPISRSEERRVGKEG